MLTELEYKTLWMKEFAELKTGMKMPSYCEYLQREVYFQDYLDIFLGKNIETFERKKVNGKYTVSIPNLSEDNTKQQLTVTTDTGEIRLIVHNDYPYRALFEKNLKIRYVLIGEAAPDGGKYIYKDAKGAYMTAPLRSFGLNPNNMKQANKRLIAFAEKEFLHLDLFPFAFDFNQYGWLRENLSGNEKLIAKFMEEIEGKVRTLIETGMVSSNWNYCFVGPKLTSKAMFKWVETERGKVFNGNPLESKNDIAQGIKFKMSEDYVERKTAHKKGLQHLPRKAKIAVFMGGTGPHFELIQRALFV